MDGAVVLVEVLLVGPDFVGHYLGGAAPELRKRIDVAALHIRHDLAVAAELGAPVLSLLRGEEDYKKRWRPTAVTHRRVLLARHPARAALFACAVLGRARLRTVLTERYPHVKAALVTGRQIAGQAGPAAGMATAVRLLLRREGAAPP